MLREIARKTQKLFHRLREVGSTTNTMPDLVQVDSNEFLSITTGQWIIGAQLLHEMAIHGTLGGSHDVVKRPFGTATQGKADG